MSFRIVVGQFRRPLKFFSVPELGTATDLAEALSASNRTAKVTVTEAGQVTPRCIYSEGQRIHCACPGEADQSAGEMS